MSRAHRFAPFGVLALLGTFVSGCGGCQGTPPEAPPKAVRGNAPQAAPPAPEQAAQPPPQLKETCALLVFTNVDGGPAPLSAQLTAEGDCTSGTVKFTWDFGDGSPNATGDTVVHTFEKPGNYTVKGTATSDALPGVSDSDTVDIVVTAPKS